MFQRDFALIAINMHLFPPVRYRKQQKYIIRASYTKTMEWQTLSSAGEIPEFNDRDNKEGIYYGREILVPFLFDTS